MSHWTTGYLAVLLLLVLLSWFASATGAMLPGPDRKEAISLRDVQNRRTHFFTHFALGK